MSGFTLCQSFEIGPLSFVLADVDTPQGQAEQAENDEQACQCHPGFVFDSGGEFGNIDIGAPGAQQFSIPRNRHEGFSIRCGYIVSTLAIADFGMGQSLGDNVSEKRGIDDCADRTGVRCLGYRPILIKDPVAEDIPDILGHVQHPVVIGRC